MYRLYFFSSILVIFTIAILSSCKIQKEIEEARRIDIDLHRDLIPYSTFISSMDSIPVSTDEELYLSTIEDICVGDTSLYLLDAVSNVIKINLSDGKVEKRLNVKGHSDSECIAARAITTSNDRVYVLDMYGLKIVTYDKNLNHVESIRLPVASMDFAAIPNGFLLFNLSCGDGEDLVVAIDRKGKIENKYIANNGIPDPILSKRIFSESPEGIIIVPPVQNQIYRYDIGSEDISCPYDFSFKAENTVAGGFGNGKRLPNAPISAFESGKYLITNYLADQKVGTCIHDKKSGHTASGLIKTGIPYPFSPMVLKDNILYSVYEGNPDLGQGKGYVILKYKLKM